MMTLFSDKMLISHRCIRGLMPNLIKKTWTVSNTAAAISRVFVRMPYLRQNWRLPIFLLVNKVHVLGSQKKIRHAILKWSFLCNYCERKFPRNWTQSNSFAIVMSLAEWSSRIFRPPYFLSNLSTKFFRFQTLLLLHTQSIELDLLCIKVILCCAKQ